LAIATERSAGQLHDPAGSGRIATSNVTELD
jgi:hypothetical protein